MLTRIDITRRPSYQLGYEEGFKLGLQLEREERLKRVRLEVAGKLLDLLDDVVIAARCELPIDEVKALRAAHDRSD